MLLCITNMNTAMIQLLLDHPERFTASEVPCCLLGIWESALEEKPDLHLYPGEKSNELQPPIIRRSEFA